MINELSLVEAPVTMSSLDIAELTGKEHKNVLADIRRTLEEAGIEGAGFLAPCKMPSGQVATTYNLPRRECDLIVSGYSVKYRLAIIDRWHQLEAQQAPVLPQSKKEWIQFALAQEETIEAQAAMIEAQAPAVEFVERYVAASGLFGIRETAKALSLKQNFFVAACIDNGVLFREGGTLQPYAQWIDAGYFEVKTGEAHEHAFTQTRFTSRGVEWVRRYLGVASIINFCQGGAITA